MYKFPKKEKLCGEKAIEGLFKNGKYISEKPIKLIWNFEENRDEPFAKSLIIVPKKQIQLATKRNRIKRKIKEAYRIQKKQLEYTLENNNQQINLAIIYQEERIIDYNTLEQKINLLLIRLIKQL